jgi:hypothetical protein
MPSRRVVDDKPSNHLRLDDLATHFNHQPCRLLAASESGGNAAVAVMQRRRVVFVDNGGCIVYDFVLLISKS